VLAGLAVVGLVAADVATYVQLRKFLIQRVDRTVVTSAHGLGESIAHRRLPARGELIQLGASNPGMYVGLIDEDGDISWAPIGVRFGETPPPQPKLPGALSPHQTLTVGAVRGGTEFRARSEPLPGGSLLVVAAPLNEVHDTLRRLVGIELLVTLAVVAAIVALGLWLVRIGLAPLRRIEATAGTIAAGDLTQRIDSANPRTEVGRLGVALNAMLGQIEEAFRERTASEQRLRRFVADASHELRTPLSAVQAYAELFDRGARDRPDDLERAMSGIERESHRMGLLVDDLLLLARLDQGRPLAQQQVDLGAVATDAVDAARALEPNRPIELQVADGLDVTGDPERLRQVLDNLLANVRAHTPASTPATVRVSRDDGRAVIEVADEGPGLSEEQAARVFERFYRADPSRARDSGGAGLGLSIVAAIAEAHGGSARVASDPDEGARFRIELPLADGIAPA
jgi:two-component system OmpR family sensor kinase